MSRISSSAFNKFITELNTYMRTRAIEPPDITEVALYMVKYFDSGWSIADCAQGIIDDRQR